MDDDQPFGQRQLLPVVIQIEDDAAAGSDDKQNQRPERHFWQADRRGSVQQQGDCRASQKAVQHRQRGGRLSVAGETNTRHDEPADRRDGQQNRRRPKNRSGSMRHSIERFGALPATSIDATQPQKRIGIVVTSRGAEAVAELRAVRRPGIAVGTALKNLRTCAAVTTFDADLARKPRAALAAPRV